MCKYLPTKNPLSGRAGQTVPQDSNIFDLLWKKFCLVWAISGAGKSTLIHYVLSQLDANCYKPSLVHYGGLQRNGMLKAIADVLGVDTNGRTVPLLISLQKQITNMASEHRSVFPVFVIDDAHLMEKESLMDICSLMFNLQKETVAASFIFVGDETLEKTFITNHGFCKNQTHRTI